MVLSTASKDLQRRSLLYRQTLRRAQGNNAAVGHRSCKGASFSHSKSNSALPDTENEPPTKAAPKKKTRAPPTKANRNPKGNPPKLIKIERKTPPRYIRLRNYKNPARARGPLQDAKDNNKEAGLSENDGDSQTVSLSSYLPDFHDVSLP
jgi:hypothetical protein